MNEAATDIDPTHALVLGDLEDSTRDELECVNAALRAALQHGTTVEIALDAEQFAEDYPARVADVDTEFERVDEGIYRGSLPQCTDALEGLLTVGTWHRFVALESVAVRRDGEVFLWYVPDHRTFELDANLAAEALDDVREVFEGRPAALVSTDAAAQWNDGDHYYSLEPPSLCVDDRCFGLSRLAGVDVDPQNRRLSLSWQSDSSGVVSRFVTRITPSPPTTLSIPDDETFERVAGTLEQLTADRRSTED